LLNFRTGGEFAFGPLDLFRSLAYDLHLDEDGDRLANGRGIDNGDIGANDALFRHSLDAPRVPRD
jgi:hypothetical protein